MPAPFMMLASAYQIGLSFQVEPLKVTGAFAELISGLGYGHLRKCGAEIAAEHLDGTGLVAVVVAAPRHPPVEQFGAFNAPGGVDFASLANEGTYWAAEVF